MNITWSEKDKNILNNTYLSKRPIPALELADKNKDWNAFKYIFKINPQEFNNHIKLTSGVFGEWNFSNKIKDGIITEED